MTAFRRGAAKDSPFFAANRVDGVSFVLGTQSGNVRNVGLTLLDPTGNPLQEAGAVDAWLSTSAAGVPLASAPSGGVAVGTNGMLITQVTNVAWKLVTSAAGLVDFNITHAGGGTFYLVVAGPSGNLIVSPAIVLT